MTLLILIIAVFYFFISNPFEINRDLHLLSLIGQILKSLAKKAAINPISFQKYYIQKFNNLLLIQNWAQIY